MATLNSVLETLLNEHDVARALEGVDLETLMRSALAAFSARDVREPRPPMTSPSEARLRRSFWRTSTGLGPRPRRRA